MKNILLIPTVAVLFFKVEGCLVTRPTAVAPTSDAHEMMDVVQDDSPLHSAAFTDSLAGQPPSSLADLRNAVREIIRPRCGSCHTSTLATAKPGAVKIFDLVRNDWSAMLTKEHFKGFERRLSSLDDSEKKLVSDLIRSELASRLQ